MNTTTKEAEVPKYGAMEVETLADLMDAITSIVTIGMSGTHAPRFVTFPSRAFGPIGWQHSPIGNRTGSHLGSCSASMRAMARELAPEWSLSSEAYFRRGIELLQQHARAFARENLLHHPTIPRPMRAASTRSAPEEDAVDPAGPTVKKSPRSTQSCTACGRAWTSRQGA